MNSSVETQSSATWTKCFSRSLGLRTVADLQGIDSWSLLLSSYLVYFLILFVTATSALLFIVPVNDASHCLSTCVSLVISAIVCAFTTAAVASTALGMGLTFYLVLGRSLRFVGAWNTATFCLSHAMAISWPAFVVALHAAISNDEGNTEGESIVWILGLLCALISITLSIVLLFKNFRKLRK